VNRQRLSRPSLKITRSEADGYVFEVWNPFIGNYQPIGSILDAMQRVDELAGLIGQMWLPQSSSRDNLYPDRLRAADAQRVLTGQLAPGVERQLTAWRACHPRYPERSRRAAWGSRVRQER
jgi:hypothetical protein